MDRVVKYLEAHQLVLQGKHTKGLNEYQRLSNNFPAGEHKEYFNVKLSKIEKVQLQITGKLLLKANPTLEYDWSSLASWPSCAVIPKRKCAAYSQYSKLPS